MIRITLSLLAFVVAGASSAPAQSLLSAGPAPSSVELLPGWPTGDGGRVAGLRIKMDKGWKTYWRAPGETGVPPVFDWTGSENVKFIEVDWPRPEVFTSFGAQTIGYRSDVTLPVRIVAEDAAAPVALRLNISYGVCSNICVPERADVRLDIPPETRNEEPALLAATLSLPTPAREAGLTAAACQIAGAGEERRFSGAFQFTQGFDAPPIVVVEGQSDIWVAPTSVTHDGGAVSVGADVELAAPDTWIDRSALRVTFLTPYEALDLRGCEG